MINLLKMFNLKQKALKKEFLEQEKYIRDWQMIAKTYAPPRKNLVSLAELPPDIQDRALFGVTTCLWEDKNSGDLRKEELLGTDESILEELYTKVKLYGPQHMKDDNGKIFVLSEYIPQVTNPLDLPLR